MPVHLGDGEYLGFKFRPDYLFDNIGSRQFITNQAKAIGDLPIEFRSQLDIILDGGNVVTCDNKMIMTDKIFSENPNIRPLKLINTIEEACHKELILLPWDMEEEFGHADGMVAYMGNGKLLLNNYCQMGKGGIEFSKRLHKILNPHFTVTELSFNHYEENSSMYINYLDTPSAVTISALSEKHDSKSDQAAMEQFKRIFKKDIKQVYALPLIGLGGVLHCVTWEFCRKEEKE